MESGGVGGERMASAPSRVISFCPNHEASGSLPVSHHEKGKSVASAAGIEASRTANPSSCSPLAPRSVSLAFQMPRRAGVPVMVPVFRLRPAGNPLADHAVMLPADGTA